MIKWRVIHITQTNDDLIVLVTITNGDIKFKDLKFHLGKAVFLDEEAPDLRQKDLFYIGCQCVNRL